MTGNKEMMKHLGAFLVTSGVISFICIGLMFPKLIVGLLLLACVAALYLVVYTFLGD